MMVVMADDDNHDEERCYDPAAHLLVTFVFVWGFIFRVSNTALNVLFLLVIVRMKVRMIKI